MKIRNTALVLLLLAFVEILGTGCNTVRGIGKDIETGGRAIQDSSKP